MTPPRSEALTIPPSASEDAYAPRGACLGDGTAHCKCGPCILARFDALVVTHDTTLGRTGRQPARVSSLHPDDERAQAAYERSHSAAVLG